MCLTECLSVLGYVAGICLSVLGYVTGICLSVLGYVAWYANILSDAHLARACGDQVERRMWRKMRRKMWRPTREIIH